MVDFEFGTSMAEGEMVGFSVFDSTLPSSYAVTTAPFGVKRPSSYKRPDNVKYWIVDNAAGTSPDMGKVKDWLDAGADAVVCSLHATKILTGCEGGFVAFRNKSLYEKYRKYIVFGLHFNQSGVKVLGDIGSNHKMSELTASYILAYEKFYFTKEYKRRAVLVKAYKKAISKFKIPYIASEQAFWIKLQTADKLNHFIELMSSYGIEVKPYYTPIWRIDQTDAATKDLSLTGVCLPTYGMKKSEIEFVTDSIGKALRAVM